MTTLCFVFGRTQAAPSLFLRFSEKPGFCGYFLGVRTLFRGRRTKTASIRCAVCGAAFTPNSNRAKYCPDCAVQVRRKKEAERQRKRYLLSTHLGR